MILKTPQMVRILAKGGIITPVYLLSILQIAKESGRHHVYFGSRQDILFKAPSQQMQMIKKAFKTLQTDYVIHRRKDIQPQNIVSSYVSADMIAATSWLSSENYLFILENFDYIPKLRVNIADPKQSLVPLFYGHLNFVASPMKDYWYLYVRKNETAIPERWPVLILDGDIAVLSKTIEEKWNLLKIGNTMDFFNLIQEEVKYNWRKIETELLFETLPPHDYEGFGKMYTSQNYWAGFYWRNNRYDIAFLEEVCQLCLQTNISNICLTPWKSFLIKDIQEKDLYQWHRLLGRFGINMRHSSLELNWHLPVMERSTLGVKRYIVKKFNNADVCVHGLTFGIKTKPEPSFTTIVIEKKPGIAFLKDLDPFVTYKVSFAKNFNANSCQYEDFGPQIPRYRLPKVLQNLTLMFYTQLPKTNDEPQKNIRMLKDDKHHAYQCQNCFSIYDLKNSNPALGITDSIDIAELPDSFCCPLCNSGKADFKAIQINQLIKDDNPKQHRYI